MLGGSKNGPIQDSNVAQISAALYYQANVIAQLTSNRAFKETFQKTIYNQIMEDFGNYIDAKARMNQNPCTMFMNGKDLDKKITDYLI